MVQTSGNTKGYYGELKASNTIYLLVVYSPYCSVNLSELLGRQGHYCSSQGQNTINGVNGPNKVG